MLNNKPIELLDKLKSSNKILISLHASPDGDSLGSALAMKHLLQENLHLTVDVITGDILPDYLKQLIKDNSLVNSIDISDINFSEYDIILCLDTASPILLSTKLRRKFVFPDNVYLINIDHHPTNLAYGQLNYIDTSATSCAQIVLDLSRQWEFNISNSSAKMLLLGIISDTDCFRYTYNKSSKVLKDSAFLMDIGVDIEEEIIKPLFFSYSINYKKFEGLVLSNMQLSKDHKFAYSIISYDQWHSLGIEKTIATGSVASGFIKDLGTCEFTFCIVEQEDHLRGSFRSSKKVDVSLFAKELNGGGHKPAAGFALAKMPLSQAFDKVLEVINRIGINKYQ